jgi:hypothetical protein
MSLVAYQCIVHFLTFHQFTMDVGDHILDARNIALDFADHGVTTNVGGGPMRASLRGRGRFSRCTGSKC